MSADPLIVGEKRYAWLSSYQFASASPVWAVDRDGLEGEVKTQSPPACDGVFDCYGKYSWWFKTNYPRTYYGTMGVLNVGVGAATVLGGMKIAAVTAPTGVGPVVGAGMIATGFSQVTYGIAQVANAFEEDKYRRSMPDVSTMYGYAGVEFMKRSGLSEREAEAVVQVGEGVVGLFGSRVAPKVLSSVSKVPEFEAKIMRTGAVVFEAIGDIQNFANTSTGFSTILQGIGQEGGGIAVRDATVVNTRILLPQPQQSKSLDITYR